MTVYTDTSVLMSVLAQDRQTPRAQEWFASGPMMLTSTWALAEVSSVLAIKVRQGLLTASQAQHAEGQIAAMTADPRSLEAVTPDDVIEARRLVRSSRNLRAPDALHLAIAVRLGVPIATFDDNLAEAMIAAGHFVVDL